MEKYSAVFYAKRSGSYKRGHKVKFRVNVELNQLTNALFTVRHTLSFMCSVHNRFGRDHCVRCALRPKLPELRVELSKECCPDAPGRIHREPTSPVSTLTARFDPRWTVVDDARVAACVLRIAGINIAFTTVNNVGTSSLFELDFSTRKTQSYNLLWSGSQ